MKNNLILLVILCLGIWSCSDDIISDIDAPESSLKAKQNIELSLQSFSGVKNNGRWLTFKSQRNVERIYSILERQIDSYKDERREVRGFMDDDPILEAWEINLNHSSLRRSNLLQMFQLYQKGEHPKNVMPFIQDFGIIDDILLAFASEEGAVQVGNEIVILQNGYTITTTNYEAAIAILDDGPKAIYEPEFIHDIAINHTESGVVTAPDCTAEFTLSGQTDTGNGVVASFIWAQNVNIGELTNVNLVWDFGDGTDPETSSNGIVTHTFDEGGTYTVCLNVSWTYTDPDLEMPVTCSIPNCEEITIEADEDCSDALCSVVQAISILDVEELTELLLNENSSNSNQMCITTQGVLAMAVPFCTDLEASDISFTFPESDEPVSPTNCWEVFCDSEYTIVLTIGDCIANLTVDFNRGPSECEDDDTDTGWEWCEYDPGEFGLSYRLKTCSEEDNFLGIGKNQIYTKIYHKKRKNNGNWKKDKADLEICFSGMVYGDQNCNCDVSQAPNECESKENKKKLKLKETIFPNFGGISAHHDEPWYAELSVNGSDKCTVSCWD